MKSIQTFLEEFNCIPFEEKPQILLQAWFKFFAIKHAQPKDSNELFQKLLEDLKELAEYINSPSRDHSNFFDNNEDHSVQNKEYSENSSKEIASSSSNQEEEGPSQDFDIRQLIREGCCIEVCEEQKQNMENTIIELVEICRQKELLCMHDNVDDLIESALNYKVLLINSQPVCPSSWIMTLGVPELLNVDCRNRSRCRERPKEISIFQYGHNNFDE
nr:hypothetical protein [Tanacetum cinerariifolium]